MKWLQLIWKQPRCWTDPMPQRSHCGLFELGRPARFGQQSSKIPIVYTGTRLRSLHRRGMTPAEHGGGVYLGFWLRAMFAVHRPRCLERAPRRRSDGSDRSSWGLTSYLAPAGVTDQVRTSNFAGLYLSFTMRMLQQSYESMICACGSSLHIEPFVSACN